MRRQIHKIWALVTSAILAAPGCSPQQPFYFHEDGDLSHYVGMATNIEYPDVDEPTLEDVAVTPAPFSLENTESSELWDLSLEESVRITLENSKVMRTLGGRLTPGGPRPATSGQSDAQVQGVPNTLLTQPQAVPTVYDPAITETGPGTGVEAALSAFDAQLQSSLTFDRTDRPQNVVRAGDFGNFFTPVQQVGSSRVDLQACKLEYSIVSPK